MKKSKLTLTALLSALALSIFVIEAQLPPIWIPGVKLGLSNVVTLCAMLFVSVRCAAAVTLIRIAFGALFCGTFTSFMFSLCGGMLAFVAMAALINHMDRRQIWAVSVIGAIAHSVGQLSAAFILIENAATVLLLPVLTICSVITGTFTGLIVQRLWFSPLRKFSLNDRNK